MAAGRIPVLMYHKVGALLSGSGDVDTFINVSAARFERHMRFMGRHGYKAITFAEAVKSFSGATTLPPKCFVITFDDGYECVGENAAPVLASLGFPATVFVVSSGAGKTNEWDAEDGRPILPLMGWPSLKMLLKAGWEIGGHTRSHPHLNRLTPAEALDELTISKREVEQQLQNRVETFCYPYGDSGPETPELVQRSGYLGACTTRSGVATSELNPYLLPRIKVSHSDDVAGLLYKMILRPMLPTLRHKRYGGKQSV